MNFKNRLVTQTPKMILGGLAFMAVCVHSAFAVTDIRCTIYKINEDGTQGDVLIENQAVADKEPEKRADWTLIQLNPEKKMAVTCQNPENQELSCTFSLERKNQDGKVFFDNENNFTVSGAIGIVKAMTRNYAIHCSSRELVMSFLNRKTQITDRDPWDDIEAADDCNLSTSRKIHPDPFWGANEHYDVPNGNCDSLGIMKETTVLDCAKLATASGYSCFQITKYTKIDPFWGSNIEDRLCYACRK